MKLVLSTLLIFCLFTQVANAEDYPEKSIEVIIPYAAGSTTDSAGRLLISSMKNELNIDMIPINTAGAGGIAGLNKLLKSKNDGYTLAFSPMGAVVAQPQIRNTPYQPDSFQLVCLVIDNPTAILVAPDSEISTLDELIEKSKKEQLFSAGPTPGSTHHMVQAYLAKLYQTKFTYLTVGGEGKIAKAILGGEADFAAGTITSADLYGLKPIVIFSENRLSEYLNVPTYNELNDDVDMISASWGLFAPKNVSPEKLKTLSQACEASVNNDNFNEKVAKQGFITKYVGYENADSHLSSEFEKHKAILEEIGFIKDKK